MNQPREFALVRDIDRCLATLAKLYGLENEVDKQRILVNAKARVEPETSSDNWNGGTYGHTLHLALPENLYLPLARQRNDLEQQIQGDINKVHNHTNEYIEVVHIELTLSDDSDWRFESGLLASPRKPVAAGSLQRIWGNGYRVFLSHKSEVKKEVAKLKEGLRLFGISGFVAHEDIHPTQQWQDEIEVALDSMDAFVALLTNDFHQSNWTDQEVGWAVGRGVPMIAVRLGTDPYGFIGKFQALSCDWGSAPREVAKLLLRQQSMLVCFLGALTQCNSFADGGVMAALLPAIAQLTSAQEQAFVLAYNSNNQLYNCGKFRNVVVSQLKQMTGHDYRLTAHNTVERMA